MKGTLRLVFARTLFVVATLSTGWLAVSPSNATAQTGGYNAICTASTGCTNGASAAYIDASVFHSSGLDFCGVLNYILTPSNHILPSTTPTVIDARGLPGQTTTSMTCSASPWAGITAPPATILLPSGTITVGNTWILPSNTRLIGTGDNVYNGLGTTIKAGSNMTTATMIQFGSSALCSSGCTGISVERLTLNGQGSSVTGIVNQYAQDRSYVDHVSLYQIRGTGLLVENNATNSGPYSNITFDTGGYSGTSSTVCAQILDVTGGTYGIHGLNCMSETMDAPAAVLLDSSNNSIEDVTIKGFEDGIRVGANGNAQSNVLVNIIGDTTGCPSACIVPIRVVHIVNSGGTYTLNNLSIAGVSTMAYSYSIYDDLTGTHLLDSSVGIYALGESASGGYSRFTTSPNAASWVVGNPTSTSAPSGACSTGSLYSNLNPNTGSSIYALYVCEAGATSGSGTWTFIH